MRRPRPNRALIVGLYLNAALLLAVLVALLAGGNLPGGLPSALAADLPAQPIAGGGGVYLMPAQFSERNWGCYVMDVERQTLCAYQYFVGEKKLRLVAAREFRHDRQLRHFNTDNPTPDEVAKIVALDRAGGREPVQEDKAPEGGVEVDPKR